MGKSTEHLLQHVPGVSHHIQSNKGVGSPMPEAHGSKDVPNLTNGESRARGNSADGSRANISPSTCDM